MIILKLLGNMPENNTMENIADAMAKAHQIKNLKNSIIIILVNEIEYNIYDQQVTLCI